METEIEQSAPVIKSAKISSEKLDTCNRNLSPVVIFAHGAGASSTSEWMIRWKNLLVNALNAVEVVTFDYPYILGKKKSAPKIEKLVGFHSNFARNVAAKYPNHPLILVGKSLGSRVSCMVAAENDIQVSGVVCLGYPLKATKGAIRDEALLQLTVPVMFVQGSNDVFCPLGLLEAVRKKLKTLNVLYVIENGDHSFQIAKKNLELTGMTREIAEERAAESVAIFVSRITTGENVIDELKENIQMKNEVKSQPDFLIPKRKVQSRPKFIRKRKASERITLNKLRKNTVEKDGEGSSCEKAILLD